MWCKMNNKGCYYMLYDLMSEFMSFLSANWISLMSYSTLYSMSTCLFLAFSDRFNLRGYNIIWDFQVQCFFKLKVKII